MASIVINNDLKVNGNLTFKRSINAERTGFHIEGVISTHLYFDNITSIDTQRFSLKGVEVLEENFGSDDYNILYIFKAEELEVFGAEDNGVHYLLYGDEMKMIEEEMYKDAHPTLGNIGSQYKDMYIKDEDTDDESEKEEQEE